MAFKMKGFSGFKKKSPIKQGVILGEIETSKGYKSPDYDPNEYERPTSEGGYLDIRDVSKMSRKEIKQNWPDDAKYVKKDIKDWKKRISGFKQKWEPAYEGGDHSFEDLSNMSKKDIKANWPDESKNIIKDVRKWKKSKRKDSKK